MVQFEKKLNEIAKEIAGEIILKEKNYGYETCLDKFQIARSLSSIYNKDLRSTTEELDLLINKFLKAKKIMM